MKFHTDRDAENTRAAVRFDAETHDTDPDEDPAPTPWKECASTVNHVRIVAGPVERACTWLVTLEPALGEHTERRLVGCLDDWKSTASPATTSASG
ncbi:hypothetical protein ACQPZ2_20985 [Nocardia pseudovaccinii]|uniref:hypothetical protein n=1 Tax=Nocardia pseudovaccinii TaxID=189540 RepID=UPI003D9473C6